MAPAALRAARSARPSARFPPALPAAPYARLRGPFPLRRTAAAPAASPPSVSYPAAGCARWPCPRGTGARRPSRAPVRDAETCRAHAPPIRASSCRCSVHTVQNQIYAPRQLLPLRALSRQLPPPHSRERVIPSLAVVLRLAPLRCDPPARHQTVQRRIQRSLIDAQQSVRVPLDQLRDAPAMHRPELQHLQHDHLERTLDDFPAPFLAAVHDRPLLSFRLRCGPSFRFVKGEFPTCGSHHRSAVTASFGGGDGNGDGDGDERQQRLRLRLRTRHRSVAVKNTTSSFA